MPALIALIAIIILILMVGVYFAILIVYPKTWKVEAAYRKLVEDGKLDEAGYYALPKQEVFIRSPYGYILYGIFVPVEGSNKTVVIAHGITVTLYHSLKYLNLFRKRGYNVLVYEHRNHGRSGKKNTTYGYYEKHDLRAIVDYVFTKSGPGAKVGTMGESLGAAVVLQHSAIDPRISFVVADCPYSDLTELMKYHAWIDYHMPAFPFLYIADLFCWIFTGMTFAKVSPIQDIATVETPILWIHGQEDTYVPTHMSIDMYHAKIKGIKKLYLAPEAGHAASIWSNPAEYDRQLGDFLVEIEQPAKIKAEAVQD
jgi:uncharacterized protein